MPTKKEMVELSIRWNDRCCEDEDEHLCEAVGKHRCAFCCLRYGMEYLVVEENGTLIRCESCRRDNQ